MLVVLYSQLCHITTCLVDVCYTMLLALGHLIDVYAMVFINNGYIAEPFTDDNIYFSFYVGNV